MTRSIVPPAGLKKQGKSCENKMRIHFAFQASSTVPTKFQGLMGY
jgi:hypothetical protein